MASNKEEPRMPKMIVKAVNEYPTFDQRQQRQPEILSPQRHFKRYSIVNDRPAMTHYFNGSANTYNGNWDGRVINIRRVEDTSPKMKIIDKQQFRAKHLGSNVIIAKPLNTEKEVGH